jgi:hypothetical protein
VATLLEIAISSEFKTASSEEIRYSFDLAEIRSLSFLSLVLSSSSREIASFL